jgi:hypothetical protein
MGESFGAEREKYGEENKTDKTLLCSTPDN